MPLMFCCCGRIREPSIRKFIRTKDLTRKKESLRLYYFMCLKLFHLAPNRSGVFYPIECGESRVVSSKINLFLYLLFKKEMSPKKLMEFGVK